MQECILTNLAFWAGDVNKGIEIIRTVIKNNPELEKGYANLGLAYMEKDEVENAINIFKRLLEINKDNPEAMFFYDKLTSNKK